MLKVSQLHRFNAKRGGTAASAIEPWASGIIAFIGRYYNNTYPHYFHGYIDDIRITKGIARYTSNFIPFPNY